MDDDKAAEYQRAWDKGYEAGQASMRTDWQDGYNEGHEAGYEDGYDSAQNELNAKRAPSVTMETPFGAEIID